MAGACSEPKYSLSRVILTKMTAFITILDDIIDTYSTTEEAMLLAKAIYRYVTSPPGNLIGHIDSVIFIFYSTFTVKFVFTCHFAYA